MSEAAKKEIDRLNTLLENDDIDAWYALTALIAAANSMLSISRPAAEVLDKLSGDCFRAMYKVLKDDM